MFVEQIFSLALLVFYIQAGESTVVNKCKTGLLPDVVIAAPEGTICEKTPCTIYLGKNIVVTQTFTAPQVLKNIKPQLLLTALGQTVPYAIGDDACQQLVDSTCPVAKGGSVKYQKSLEIPNNFPRIGVSLQLSIIDKDTNSTVTCFSLDVRATK